MRAYELGGKNLVVDAGEIFFAPLDADDQRIGGEDSMGDCVGAVLAVRPERTQAFTGSGPRAQLIVDVVKSVEYALTITGQNIVPENWQRWIGADDPTEIADTAIQVADEKIRVEPGQWIQIGVKTASPTGIRAVNPANLAVHDSNAAGAKGVVLAADKYDVDAERGRIRIKPATVLTTLTAGGHAVHVTYTPQATTRRQVRASATRTIRTGLRYLAAPAAGRAHNIYIPVCTVTPQGEMQLSNRDETQRFGLECRAVQPSDDRAPVYIDDLPALP